MTRTRPVRTRTTLVAATAAVVVVTATASVSAHEGTDDPDSIHACVASSGALRVPSDPRETCRSNETPLHWAVGGRSGAEELDAFKKQLLATDNVDDLVDWSNLRGVPQWVVDGLPAWLQDGAVDGSEVVDDSLISADLRNGSVLGEDLGGGTVSGRNVEDGSLTAEDLAGSYGRDFVVGAVTGEKIADQMIERRDLGPGAVTPDKQRSVTASAAEPSVGPIGGEGVFPQVTTAVDVAAGSAVMVTGQVQLELVCVDCTSLVEFVLVRTRGFSEAVVSPTYRVDLSTGHGFDVATVSSLDHVDTTGSYAYQVRLRSDGDGSVLTGGGVEVNIQVLGLR